MQWMEIKTAAIGVINWVCQKMVKIHHHRQYHHQPGLPPAILKENPSHPKGNQQVKTKVNDDVAHLEEEKKFQAWKSGRKLHKQMGILAIEFRFAFHPI